MHIRNLDFNLLKIASALYRHKNVSKASAELGLSQSAVSHALGRLRDQFEDPLFVRTSKGMALTEYAKRIQNEVLDIELRLELLANRKEKFSPQNTNGRITIASTDYFEIVVMPTLLKIIESEAPHLQISLRPTRGELPKRDLEDGTIDLAIAGFYRNLPEGFYQSKLFTDDFATAAGKNSLLYNEKNLSAEQFYSARHALITLQGDFKDSAKGVESREIVYGSYSFTGMAWILQDSGLLLTAPARLFNEYKRFFPIQIWRCPIPRGHLDIRVLWHAQTHENPLHLWFRTKLKEACSNLP